MIRELYMVINPLYGVNTMKLIIYSLLATLLYQTASFAITEKEVTDMISYERLGPDHRAVTVKNTSDDTISVWFQNLNSVTQILPPVAAITYLKGSEIRLKPGETSSHNYKRPNVGDFLRMYIYVRKPLAHGGELDKFYCDMSKTLLRQWQTVCKQYVS